ncbi:DUF6341 family protein [Flavobacterium adhaerens]|uniref:DUF6341 family protein n=1 Tax=Flavobacterium adhaerens TaxID=3149043 RepID=UPI0032B4E378
MTSFFEGIQYLFVNILFAPLDFFRALELKTWFGANFINWVFIIICSAAIVYWIKQLKLQKENGEDEQDTTAHSFLK